MADNNPGASRNETIAAGRSATDPLEAEPVPGEPVVTAPNQPEASSDTTGILSPDHWAQVRRKGSKHWPLLVLTTIPNRTQSQPMNFQSTRPLLVQLLRHSRLLFWSTGLSRAGDSTVRLEMLVTGMYLKPGYSIYYFLTRSVRASNDSQHNEAEILKYGFLIYFTLCFSH